MGRAIENRQRFPFARLLRVWAAQDMAEHVERTSGEPELRLFAGGTLQICQLPGGPGETGTLDQRVDASDPALSRSCRIGRHL